MVTRSSLLPRMSVGYQPTCLDKPSLWPCYPIMPPYGLMGLRAGYPGYPVIPRYGVSGLTADGTGLFGTGLFCLSGDNCSWGLAEIIFVAVGGYMLWATFRESKRTAKAGYLQLEGAAQRKRTKRAAKYRAKAKRLEEKGLGGIWPF